MKAVVAREQGGHLEVEDLDLAGPGPGEVRVRLRASGVCHSDLSIWDGTLGGSFPVVLGHEGAGEITELGAGVADRSIGDHVILSWIPPCGRCRYCWSGQANLCTAVRERQAGRGHLSSGGDPVAAGLGTAAFAEETVVPAEAAIPIPADVPDAVAALVGCGVMTGVGAVINTARVRPGESVVVIGCGGVGLNVLQGARLAGADPICAIDPLPAKREAARRFGATYVAAPEDLVEVTRLLTEGRGFDYAFEVVGRSSTIRLAYDATRRGGTTVVVGAGSRNDPVTFSAGELFSTERRLVGCLYGSADVRTDFSRILRLWQAGRLDLEGLVSRRIGLGDVNEAFEAMRAGDVVRSVIELP